jgi:hypothetical protein
MIITQSEIVESLTISKEFPPQYLKNTVINKAELKIANEVLGEDFYEAIQATKTATGIFSNVDYQFFYDNYLKMLISESVFLTACISLMYRFDGVGAVQNTANNAQVLSKEAIEQYKAEYSKAVSDSIVLCDSYLKKNATKFTLYKGNNSNLDNAISTKSKSFAGFCIDPEMYDF